MSKVTAYTELTAPSTDDILYIVDSAAGTPTGKKVTVGNLIAGGLGVPTSGAILTYSTAATSGVAWSKPSTGTYMMGSSIGVPTWSKPSKYVSIVGFSSGGTLASGPCGYVQIPPEVNGYNLTYVSGFHASSAASNGKTEITLVRERAGASAVMLTSAVEVDSGAICSSASASQALIDTTNDDVATGDIIELHVKVIPSASAPKGITGQLGFSLP